MKIAITQLNYQVGNFSGNLSKIVSSIEKARDQDADLVIFSEMAVCGYPPLDLLEYKSFAEKCIDSINKISKVCNGIAAIVGSPSFNVNPSGKNLYNSAFFLNDGKIQNVIHKTLLPTYDIFDEYRHFEPNKEFSLIEFKGKQVALTICEDIWDVQPAYNSFGRNRLYTLSPMKHLSNQQPELIINIAAGPFSFSHEKTKKNIFIRNAQKYNVPLIYVNQVGAQTELIFDGSSMVLNSNGDIVQELKSFEEDFQIVDFSKIEKAIPKNQSTERPIIAKIHDALVLGVRDYFYKLNLKTAVLGLSGGIDSAVTLVLAVEALGNKNVRVFLLPSKYSSGHSISDSVELAKNLKIDYDIADIEPIVKKYKDALEPYFKNLPEDITEENIQSRIRGTLLMAISNKFGNILLNTSNKSEAAVGYGTLYGDMAGGLSVIGDIYKTDVYKLAEYINREMDIIPRNIITKPPSAELRPDQKDTDSLPDYAVLDDILFRFIEMNQSIEEIIQAGNDNDIVAKVVNLVNQSEYKRYQTPPILRVTSKAFGAGRRIPLTAKFNQF